MPLSLKQVQQQRAEILAEAEAIDQVASSENRDLTPEEATEVEGLLDKHKAMESMLRTAEKFEKAKAEMMANRIKLTGAQSFADMRPNLPVEIPKRNFARPALQLRAFSREQHEDPHQAAYDTGMWLRSIVFNDPQAIQHVKDRQLMATTEQQDVTIGSSSDPVDAKYTGGYLVPELTAATVLRVLMNTGVAPMTARVYPMAGEAENVPKREQGLTVVKPVEAAAITTSEMGFSQVQLRAQDAFTLTQITNRLLRENVVSAADQVVLELGHAFAKQVDSEYINGDGAGGAPYYGITGLVVGLTGTGTAGILTLAATNTAWTDITSADIASLVALLPDRYHDGNTCFICSRAFWATVIEPTLETRGASKADLSNASPLSLKGYPIYLSDYMPTASTVDQVCLLFGNFYESVLHGTRQMVTIATSAERYFDQDMIAIRGKACWDTKVHRTGDASTPGGYVGLRTAAA